MSVEELEADLSGIRLRWTFHTKSGNAQSPEFQFQSGVWKLRHWKGNYYYRFHHGLVLYRCSGVSPDPFHASVGEERSEDGRMLDVLLEKNHITYAFEKEDTGWYIWRKAEEEILTSVPEFRLHGILKLIVDLKVGEDSESRASQTEWSIAGQSGITSSTSVQTTLLMNVLPCLESLATDLDQLRVDDSHHDVEFHCEGHTTKAHKSIVSKRCPVIASMLSTDMVEGRTGVVSIPNMAPDIFAQFLRYLYCGRVEELTFDTALRLYEAGDQYEVLGLAKRCSEYLMEHLSVDNACEVLVVFDAHGNRECVEKVVDFMVENRVPLVSEEWSAFCDKQYKLAIKVLNRSLKAGVK